LPNRDEANHIRKTLHERLPNITIDDGIRFLRTSNIVKRIFDVYEESIPKPSRRS